MATPEKEPEEISSQATVAAESAPAEPAPPSDDDLLKPGSLFGDYEIVKQLGRGGMGVVYSCRHRTLDRLAAIKILNLRARGGGTTGEGRFLREARSAARLDHHNVVTIYNAGQHQGLLFIEMQLVDGRPLSELTANSPLDPIHATRYVEQVAHALTHAHDRGIIHRDIKPDNVLVTADDVVKVTDFGLAKHSLVDTALTAPGSIMGTPAYMAPEQWQSDPTDGRTDLYSLGVTYFQLLVGRPPYRGKLGEFLRLHIEGEVPLAHEANPAVPRAMSAVIARLMAKRPGDRYQRAADLVIDLRRLQRPPDDPPADDSPRSLPDPPRPDAIPAPAAVLIEPERRPTRVRGPRGVLATLVLALVAAASVLALDATGAFQGIELRSIDRRMLSRGTPLPSAVTVVGFDEESARALGNPPRRDAIADLIQQIEVAGARAVGIDLFITDPDPGIADGALIDATAETKVLVHALDLHAPLRRASAGALADPALERFAAPSLSPEGLPSFARAGPPFPALLARTRSLGHAVVQVDPDGLVRRVPLLAVHGGKVFPALSLAVLLRARGASLADLTVMPGRIRISKAGSEPLELPVDPHGMLELSVRGGLDRFPRLSFARVLALARSSDPKARRSLEESFRGRTVLLGNWLSGQADVQPMPGMQIAPLVLAHATAVETMLSRDFLRPSGWGALTALALLLALLGVAAGRFLPLPYPLLLAPALLGGFWLLGSILLERHGLAIPTVAPALAFGLAAIGGGGLRAWIERRQLRRVSEALGRYLPRRVAHQILADPSALRLGGKRKELTVLYAELHDFATRVEQLEPEEVGELLELFFSITGETVARHGGTLDRFNGDGVRAFFGDPLPQQDHAAIAVRCASEIRNELLRALGRWAGASRRRPGLGVGLSSGYVTVGNIGTLQRMEYTVLGRHVELAEELARRARDGVLVGSRTRTLAVGIAFKQVGEAFEPMPE